MKSILSPKELAEAIGVSESSLKRWVDDGRLRAARTAGGHRRIPITEAIRFIRQTRSPLVRPDLLGLSELSLALRDDSSTGTDADRLFGSFKSGRGVEARGLVLSLYLAGEPVAAICDAVISEAMARLGELWRHQEDGVFLEHRATDICLQAMNQLRLTLPPISDGPMAVGCAPSGDPYLLGTLAAAVTLTSEGYQAINLGPETPFGALVAAAERYRPRLVWVSISAVRDRRVLVEGIAMLSERLAAEDISLAIGGREVEGLALPGRANLCVGSSMVELAAFAKGLTASTGNGGRHESAPGQRN
jgi:excisionase family DNA binding protein